MLPVIGELRPWADPEIVSLRRLGMRPPTVAHRTAAAIRAGEPSPWRRSLGGRWHFRLYDSPDAVPATAVTRPVTDRWRRIDVPGNWTLQDVGDHPQYTNVQMPFDGPPPRLPERNPTGVHRRTMRIPARWTGRQIVLHVGGAESVHAVYVNGAFAGYGTDSRLASEYDITALVTTGDNDIAIVVARWSAHSYVEDQDQWWMAGLHREVFVEARGEVHLHRLDCDAGLRGTTGTLRAMATLGGLRPPERGWTVRFTLETDRGRRVGRPVVSTVPYRFATPYRFAGHVGVADFDIADVDPWSAESPTRYRVVAELCDPSGEVVEAHEQLVGFRSVEVRDRQLLVNGEPVWVFGVNRHDHHPVRGKAVTVDDLRDDLVAMRRHNITAIRCAHYPNDPHLLDLCDEIGMYVVDEANIESHAYNTSLCHDDRYRSAWLARGARMVERDRNHPSVILWSLGNESGYGAHHDALAGWIRHSDPSRPLHYEGAVFHAGWVDGGTPASDIVCPMYPTIDAIVEYGRHGRGDRPLIMCEYSHAMGNSNGSLADYWDAITSIPGLQGGFIWEWKDHGLLTTLPNGRRGFAHGGHFGEARHDGNFVADGLMSSDLQPHPVMQEVAWVYRPVTVAASGDGRSLSITNRRSFTTLDDLRASWELVDATGVRAAGELDLGSIGPGATVDVPTPGPDPTDADTFLTVRWTLRRSTAWAPRGHLVAWDQVAVAPSDRAPGDRADAPGSAATGRGHARGTARSSRADLLDVSAAITALEPCVFRAPVDNDGFKLMPDLRRRSGDGGMALERWQDAGVDRLPADECITHHQRTEQLADGSVIHHHEIVVDDDHPDLARVGVRFEVARAYELLRWFGRGPLENYPDRHRGALIGVWERAVDEPPYLVPQEFGLRTDCRWFEFIDPTAGRVLRLDAVDPDVVHVSATRHRDADLYAAPHQTDLRRANRLVVHVDVAHRGLGTASCGPDVLDRYRITPGTHRFSYRLSMR